MPTPISENNDGVLDSISHQVKDIPVASTGDIETMQTSSTNLDFFNASPSSDGMSSLPQLVSSDDPPTSNATSIACSTTAAPSTKSMAEDPIQDAKLTSLPTTSSLIVPSITMDDPASRDTDVGKNGTELIVNANPMQVDVENRQKGESSSTDVAVIALPAWLVALNMDVYLLGCSDITAWKGLIQSLYKFEKLNTISGVHHCNFIMGYH